MIYCPQHSHIFPFCGSSAITWLFRSRELCPKLHRWALRLAEHVVPDALSRLPHAKDTPADADDFFPDDFTSGAPSDFLGPRGPCLDGVWLAEIDAVGGAGTDSGDPLSELSSAPPAHDANDTRLLALRALPFAMCAVLDADSITLRRGSRARTPSVRLRPLGDAQLPPLSNWGTRIIFTPAHSRRSSHPCLRHRPRRPYHLRPTHRQ